MTRRRAKKRKTEDPGADNPTDPGTDAQGGTETGDPGVQDPGDQGNPGDAETPPDATPETEPPGETPPTETPPEDAAPTEDPPRIERPAVDEGYVRMRAPAGTCSVSADGCDGGVRIPEDGIIDVPDAEVARLQRAGFTRE